MSTHNICFCGEIWKIVSKLSSELSYIMRKPVYAYANNKGADQPAHSGSLISAFVVHCLDSIITQTATPNSMTLACFCS